MNILTIDPGTRCGWAALWGNGNIDSGVQEFPLGRGDSPGMRYIRFRVWFVDLLVLTKPELVVYERPFMRGGFATEFLSALTSRIQEECSARKIEYQAVNPATLKKAITGTAKSDKAAMVRAADERWRGHFCRSIKDDDEADALNLLSMAMQENRQTPPTSAGKNSKS